MPRLVALNTYWNDHPPVHLLLAAFLNFKSAAAAASKPNTVNDPSELAGLMAMLRPE